MLGIFLFAALPSCKQKPTETRISALTGIWYEINENGWFEFDHKRTGYSYTRSKGRLYDMSDCEGAFYYYLFSDDEFCRFSFIWKESDDQLTINFTGTNKNNIEQFNFKISDNTLTLVNDWGNVYHYSREPR